MHFRYDINGLRAIAVLAVVIFHFEHQWLPGGFAGVDVFFVISGFLMTSIIFNGIQSHSFHLFQFYIARANRIIPVLAIMSAALLIFGWFYLFPVDYRELGQQIERSSLFTSNILFSRSGGYFDTAEHRKWLLHSWSLSVEWQFYILFPLLILVLKKYFSVTSLKRVVVLLCIVSFIYCIYATAQHSKTAYFLLSSRAWEMLFGGLAFLYPWTIHHKKTQILTQCLGLSLILISYFFISKSVPWPGYMALLPVFGTYLIIQSHYQHNPCINNLVFQHIGRWSYSIYVWHWPIVVFGIYCSIPHWWLFGIPLSIFVGCLSYHTIEQWRFPKYTHWKEIVKAKPIYLSLLVLCCGYTVKEMDGLLSRFPEQAQIAYREVENSNPFHCDQGNFYECIIGTEQNIQAMIIGDSHADSLTTSLASIFNLDSQGIVSVSTSACAFVYDMKFYDPQSRCPEINQKRFQLLTSEKYENIPVVLAGRYASYLIGENDPDRIPATGIKPMIYFDEQSDNSYAHRLSLFQDHLVDTLCSVSNHHPVYIIQPIPELGFNAPKRIFNNIVHQLDERTSIPYEQYLSRTQSIRDMIKKSADQCNVTVLDPTDILCKDGECIAEHQGRPIYRDGDHLSEYGNKILQPMFKEAFAEL